MKVCLLPLMFNHNLSGLILDNLAFHGRLTTKLSQITSKERTFNVKDILGKVHRTNFDHIFATKCPSDYGDTGNFRDNKTKYFCSDSMP